MLLLDARMYWLESSCLVEINLNSKIQLQISSTAGVSAIHRWRVTQQKMRGREVALLIALQDRELRKIISSHPSADNNFLFLALGKARNPLHFSISIWRAMISCPAVVPEELINTHKAQTERTIVSYLQGRDVLVFPSCTILLLLRHCDGYNMMIEYG